jgi:prolyl 4-hydroxylase
MTQESELERRAASGDKDCQIVLAGRLEDDGRNELAREWYARAAEHGDLSALVALSKNLLARKPVRAQLGVNMVRTAAERGDAEALRICAVIASQDANLHARWSVALDFLGRAAEKGSALARRELQLLARSEAATHSWRELARLVNIEPWLKPAAPQVRFQSPRIVTCEGFASAAECDWLVERAKPRLKPAEVYDPHGKGGLRADDIRNNSDTSFDIVLSDLVLMALRERIGRLALLHTDDFEPTMVLHYTPGQQFAPHFDFVEAAAPHLAQDIAENGQRVATLLLYLNEDFEGGETEFPALSWRYKGRKGDALLFWNVGATGVPDPATLHAGLQPAHGEKWVLSQWMRRKSPPIPA